MNRYTLEKYIPILVALVITSLGLSTQAQAIMLVTRDQEVKIGKQVEASSIKEYGGLCTDQELNKRVARVGAQVAAVSPRKDVTYTYKVVNSKIINAFAAPGGPVMITKALAEMLTSDAELAFVLGHETGHIAAQHGRKAINRAMIAQGLVTLVAGNASQATQLGINVTYSLFESGYSRDQEYEADRYGVTLMSKAGYNAEGAVKALAKLGMDRTSGINKYFASHPDTPDRVDRVAKQGRISKDREQALIKEAQSEQKNNKAKK